MLKSQEIIGKSLISGTLISLTAMLKDKFLGISFTVGDFNEEFLVWISNWSYLPTAYFELNF